MVATPPANRTYMGRMNVRLGFISRINFRCLPVKHENRKNWIPRKFPAIRYKLTMYVPMFMLLNKNFKCSCLSVPTPAAIKYPRYNITFPLTAISSFFRFYGICNTEMMHIYSKSCFYILCRSDMNRKRCSVSRELLPYKPLFRDFKDPKYDFKAPIPRKRPIPQRKKVVSNMHAIVVLLLIC